MRQFNLNKALSGANLITFCHARVRDFKEDEPHEGGIANYSFEYALPDSGTWRKAFCNEEGFCPPFNWPLMQELRLFMDVG